MWYSFDFIHQTQVSSCVRAQPVGDDATMQRRLSLAEPIPTVSPDAYGAWTSAITILNTIYRQTSKTSRTLVGNKIIDHSDIMDIVGASPGAAPIASSFSTWHLASTDWAKQLQDETSNM